MYGTPLPLFIELTFHKSPMHTWQVEYFIVTNFFLWFLLATNGMNNVKYVKNKNKLKLSQPSLIPSCGPPAGQINHGYKPLTWARQSTFPSKTQIQGIERRGYRNKEDG